MPHPKSAAFTRWTALVAAAALTCVAAWAFYQAFFVLDRFGLMAILLALAALVAATLLWWRVAEASVARTCARIRHMLLGGVFLAMLAVSLEAIRESRIRPLHLVIPDMLFNALFLSLQLTASRRNVQVFR